VSTMLPAFRPPGEPPEKWKTIKAALEDDQKTKRLQDVMRTNMLTDRLPWALAATIVGVAAVVAAAIRW